jgi:hypothetical protein
MWRPNEPVEEDVSDLPGIDPQKRRRSRRRTWRDGLADQTVVQNLEDVRSTAHSLVGISLSCEISSMVRSRRN